MQNARLPDLAKKPKIIPVIHVLIGKYPIWGMEVVMDEDERLRQTAIMWASQYEETPENIELLADAFVQLANEMEGVQTW